MRRKRLLRTGVVVIALFAAALALSASAGARPVMPKASHIAYMSTWDGEADIYSMDTEGLQKLNLTHDKAVGARQDVEPAWSPDGQFIAFQRTMKKEPGWSSSSIFVVGNDGSDLHALTPPLGKSGFYDDHPTWSPDGNSVIFSSNRDGNFELYITKANGSGIKQLTFTDWPTENIQPAWSPDGQWIAFVRNEPGSVIPTTNSLFVMQIATGLVYRLTMPLWGAGDRDPTWSPNSTRIAFTSDRAGNDDVYVVDLKGTGLTQVTTKPSSDYHPTWAPFGNTIAFLSDRTTATEIYTTEVPIPTTTIPAGEAVLQLTFDGAYKSNPAWERGFGMTLPYLR